MSNWYLNITKVPTLSSHIKNNIDKLSPHKATQWNYKSNVMKEYKVELLKELTKIQNNRCVYCGLSFQNRLIDREHFVSKGVKQGYQEFTFNPYNLFASCAHCNRRLKGQKNVISKYNKKYELCEFSIIHPFLDIPEDYLEYWLDSQDRPIYIKEKPNSGSKGIKTINFFKLHTVGMVKARKGYLTEIEDIEDIDPIDPKVKKTVGYKFGSS